jgi:hypothetical protein
MWFAQLRWEMWFVPVAGLVSAGLLTFFGMSWFRRKPGGARAVANRPALCLVPDLAPARRTKAGWNGTERRAHRRARVMTLEILVREVGSAQKPHTGLVLDRSLGGLGIELPEAVAVGQNLQFRLRKWDKKANWVTAEVRYCRRKGEAWRVGCQFLDVSAWEVMNIFGPPDPDEAVS